MEREDDMTICEGCDHSITIVNKDGSREVYCRELDSQVEDVATCSAFVPESETLHAGAGELRDYLIAHLGSELSEKASIKGAALTIARRYRALKDKAKGLERYMEQQGIQPAREPGESVFDWIRRGFDMGRRFKAKWADDAHEVEANPTLPHFPIELPDAPELEGPDLEPEHDLDGLARVRLILFGTDYASQHLIETYLERQGYTVIGPDPTMTSLIEQDIRQGTVSTKLLQDAVETLLTEKDGLGVNGVVLMPKSFSIHKPACLQSAFPEAAIGFLYSRPEAVGVRLLHDKPQWVDPGFWPRRHGHLLPREEIISGALRSMYLVAGQLHEKDPGVLLISADAPLREAEATLGRVLDLRPNEALDLVEPWKKERSVSHSMERTQDFMQRLSGDTARPYRGLEDAREKESRG